MRLADVMLVVILAAFATPSSAASYALSDLRNFYGMQIGPSDLKHLPHGVFDDRHGGACRCRSVCRFGTDSYSSFVVDNTQTPGGRCGLGAMQFSSEPDTLHGVDAAANRELHTNWYMTLRRYGTPAFRDRNEGWTRFVYCTDMRGRSLTQRQLSGVREFYEYQFVYSGEMLDEILVSWTDRCQGTLLYPPIE